MINNRLKQDKTNCSNDLVCDFGNLRLEYLQRLCCGGIWWQFVPILNSV